MRHRYRKRFSKHRVLFILEMILALLSLSASPRRIHPGKIDHHLLSLSLKRIHMCSIRLSLISIQVQRNQIPWCLKLFLIRIMLRRELLRSLVKSMRLIIKWIGYNNQHQRARMHNHSKIFTTIKMRDLRLKTSSWISIISRRINNSTLGWI